MKYDTREEVERIGRAGSKMERDRKGLRFRYLSTFWLYVEEDDYAFTPHAREGFWEAWITRWISEELEHNQIFIDVGANVGYYSMMAATSRVQTFAIEPNPDLYDNLYNAGWVNRCNDKLSIIPVALSDKNGNMRMVVPDGHSGGASIMVSDEPTMDLNFKTHDVEVRALDRIISLGFMPQNVLIKIDAEGAEPLIWDGMQKIWHGHNCTVVLEWHGVRWKDAWAFSDKLFQHKVCIIDENGLEQPITQDWLMCCDDLIMITVRKNET